METKGRDDIQSADRNILSTKNFVADKTSFQENEREIKIFPDKNWDLLSLEHLTNIKKRKISDLP